MLTTVWRRPDGGDLFLVSPSFLHIFDHCMSMLPFAIRTDMIKAFQQSDDAFKTHKDFMMLLLEEHKCDAARGQLKQLWGEWIKSKYPQETDTDDDPAGDAAFGRAPTPPADDGALGAAASEGND